MFNPNDPCTHDSSCFCHWCTGGREDYPPVPKPEFQADLLRQTDHGDECPLCQCGTVEHVNGEVKCRGECGSVAPMSMSQIGLAMLEQDERDPASPPTKEDWAHYLKLGPGRFRELAEAEDASGGITSVGGLIMKTQEKLEDDGRISIPGLSARVRKGSQGHTILKALLKGVPEGTREAIRMFTGESDHMGAPDPAATSPAWLAPNPSDRWYGTINSLANMLISALSVLQKERQLNLATPRHDLIPLLQIERLPDGVEVAIVSCQDHDAFTALPGGLEILGRIYGKSGWNSDRNVAYYRTDRVLGAAR